MAVVIIIIIIIQKKGKQASANSDEVPTFSAFDNLEEMAVLIMAFYLLYLML